MGNAAPTAHQRKRWRFEMVEAGTGVLESGATTGVLMG
jgi:hypothetical protein